MDGLDAGAIVEWRIAPALDGAATDVSIVYESAKGLPRLTLVSRLAGMRDGRPIFGTLLRDLRHVAEGGSLAGSR